MHLYEMLQRYYVYLCTYSNISESESEFVEGLDFQWRLTVCLSVCPSVCLSVSEQFFIRTDGPVWMQFSLIGLLSTQFVFLNNTKQTLNR